MVNSRETGLMVNGKDVEVGPKRELTTSFYGPPDPPGLLLVETLERSWLLPDLNHLSRRSPENKWRLALLNLCTRL